MDLRSHRHEKPGAPQRGEIPLAATREKPGQQQRPKVKIIIFLKNIKYECQNLTENKIHHSMRVIVAPSRSQTQHLESTWATSRSPTNTRINEGMPTEMSPTWRILPKSPIRRNLSCYSLCPLCRDLEENANATFFFSANFQLQRVKTLIYKHLREARCMSFESNIRTWLSSDLLYYKKWKLPYSASYYLETGLLTGKIKAIFPATQDL